MRAKKKQKPLKAVRAVALTTLQKMVRLRDADNNGYCKCVTCGCVRRWNEGMQGGHFIAKGKGGTNEWALDERNVHPQCAECNSFGMKFHNKQARYTMYMIRRYGPELVDMMTLQNKVTKYTRGELMILTDKWKKEIKFHKDRIGEYDS